MVCTQGLFLFGTSERLRGLIREMESGLRSGWRREHQKEQNANRTSGSEMFCFACEGTAGRPPAEIWLSLSAEEPAILRLATALSLYSDRLTQCEFELVMNEFVTTMVMPAAGDPGIEIVFHPKEPTACDRMPRNVLSELQNYTRVANKTGRNAHPNDQALWTHFVVSAYEARADVDGEFVEGWFYDNGWTSRDARLLARSFDDSRKSLVEYDRRRRLG
jgi:hypothetical protein